MTRRLGVRTNVVRQCGRPGPPRSRAPRAVDPRARRRRGGNVARCPMPRNGPCLLAPGRKGEVKREGGEKVVVRKLLPGSCCQEVVASKLLSGSCRCSCFGVVCTYLATVEQPHFRNMIVLAVFRVVMFSVVFRIQIRTPPTPIMQYFVRGILHHAFKH